MQLVLETAPENEPISTSELALHLRLDDYESVYEHDMELGSIIKAATIHVENITSRKLITQTWNYYFNAFPDEKYIKIPFGNLQSVSSVKYTDSDGDETTMTVSDDYIVEINGDQCGRIVLPYSTSWPSFTAYPSNPIKVQFICGWTSKNNLPDQYKSVIKLICSDLYENREGQVLSSNSYRKNNTIMNLLNSSILRDSFL